MVVFLLEEGAQALSTADLPSSHLGLVLQPILQWLSEDYPSARASAENSSSFAFGECQQEAGDIMYVPCEWGHAVLNLEDTVGMAVEFKYRYTDGT